MTQTHFITELKVRLSEETWPWVVTALRQDALVWDSLEGTDLGPHALAAMPNRPESWSPAALALLVLNYPAPLGSLRTVPMQPLAPNVRQQVTRAYEEWQIRPPAPPLDMTQAGLLALSIRERRRIKGSWEGLSVELGMRSSLLRSVLACLYGMIPDPIDMLQALLLPGDANPQSTLVLHTLLSNPLPPQSQAEILYTLLEKASIPQRQATLRVLAGQRPALATNLAQRLLNGLHSGRPSSSGQPSDRSDNLDHLTALLQGAEAYRLAAQPAQSIPLLAESLKAARRLQAYIAAELGQAAGQISDSKTALEAWKQATQLAPDSPFFAAKLALTLLDAGRTADARAYLTAKQADGTMPNHPVVLLALALVAIRSGETDAARLAAAQALELAENRLQGPENASAGSPAGTTASLAAPTNASEPAGFSRQLTRSTDLQGFYTPLAQLLLDVDLPAEAARAARLGLHLWPNDPGLLELLAKSKLEAGRVAEALPVAFAAIAQAPDQVKLRSLLVECLEACEDWQAALQERTTLLEGAKTPSAIDFCALASCALKANQPQQAVKACQQAIQLDPENGRAYRLLGEATFATGDRKAALEYYQQAAQLAPHQPDTWIALAQAHQIAGQASKALEVLRSASLAAPNSPEIHLAIGEAYLAENAPTQAVSSLRRAASLVSSSAYQAKAALKSGASPDAQPDLASRISFHLGETLRQLGHLDEARLVLEQAYTTAADRDPQPELAYAYGQTLLALKEYRPALAPLEAVVKTAPEDPAPYLDYARTLLQLPNRSPAEGRLAIPLLERVLESMPGHFEALALLAEAQALDGNLTGATQAYRQALDTPQAQAPAWRSRLALGLGRVALKLGQPETAIAALQEAAQADQQDPEIQRSLSEAYLEIGLTDEAFGAAVTARQLNPSDLNLLAWFAEQALCVQARPGGAQLSAQAEAIQALRYASELAPERADLLIRLGQIQLQTGDQAAALETFGKLTSLQYVSTGDLFQAARSLLKLGNPRQAVSLLEHAREMVLRDADETEAAMGASQPELLAELAAAYQQTGKLREAVAALDQAIVLDPDDPQLHLSKADFLQQMDKPQAALACLKNALSLSPGDGKLHLRSALILRSIGDLPAALTHAGQAVSFGAKPSQSVPETGLSLPARCMVADLARAMLQPERARELLGDRWPPGDQVTPVDQLEYACLRAELALDAEEEVNAEEALAVAQKVDENHPRCLAARARLTSRKGNYAEALKIIQSALPATGAPQSTAPTQLPAGPATLRALGDALMELDQWEEALRVFRQGLEAAPHEPVSHLHLAQALVLRAEAQRLSEAMEIIQHAPGPAALDDEAYREFESAIQSTGQQMARWVSGQENKDASQQLEIRNLQSITRWHARGRAVFQPNLQNAETLQTVLETIFAAPEDIAALVAVQGMIGDWISAVKAAQAFPQHPLVLRQLALILSDANPRQALGAARSALAYSTSPAFKRSQEAPLFNTLLARLSHRAGIRDGDQATALQTIHTALAAWPNEPRWHALAAEIYMGRGDRSLPPDIPAAIAHLEQATRLEPRYASHYLSLGNVYLENGENLRAIQALEQASRIAPEKPEPWLALAQAQLVAGELEQAAASAERAIERSADPITSLLLRGEIDIQTNNAQGAAQRAQAVLNLKPDDPAALHLQARALSALNRPAEALAALEKGIPLAQQPLPLLMERARLIRRSKGLDAALEALRGLAERYPDEPGVLALLAEALVEAGRSEAAIQSARLALQADKGKLAMEEQAYLHYLVGRQLRRAGQLDQAIFHLTEAIQLSPGHLEPYLELGRAHQERRQHAQALVVYKQAVSVAPNDHRAFYHAGLALKESKDYLGAEAMLRRAADLAPNDVSIHRLLGALVALNLVHNRHQSPTKL